MAAHKGLIQKSLWKGQFKAVKFGKQGAPEHPETGLMEKPLLLYTRTVQIGKDCDDGKSCGLGSMNLGTGDVTWKQGAWEKKFLCFPVSPLFYALLMPWVGQS